MAYRPDPQRRAGGDGCGKVAAGIGGERGVGHPDGFRVKYARVAGNRTAACGSILAQVAAGAQDAQPGGYVTIRSRRCTVLRQADLPHQITIPWLDNRTLRYEYAG